MCVMNKEMGPGIFDSRLPYDNGEYHCYIAVTRHVKACSAYLGSYAADQTHPHTPPRLSTRMQVKLSISYPSHMNTQTQTSTVVR